MSTIADVESTSEIIELQIITRIDEWDGLFDRVEVWRSHTSAAGPFEALTADQWEPAVIPGSAGPEPAVAVAGRQVQLSGTQLLLRVDAQNDYVVTFATPGYVTYGQAALDITAQSGGAFRAYVDSTGALVLVGTRPGTGAVLEVMGGDAAPLLGLPTTSPDNLGYGKDAHIGLVRDTPQHTFIDRRGNKRYFYRTRFLNKTTQVSSEFSAAFSLGQAFGISTANVVCGYVDLAATTGRPLANQLVQVYAATQTNLVEGKLVTGPRQTAYTDINGHAEFTLVRGVAYTVSITGTDLVRQFVAPVDPAVAIFSLFEKSIGTQDDLFKVDRPPLVYAERRSF